MTKKKELLFSGGAGGIAFQFGYAQGLLEIIGKQKLQEYHLGGVSAGSVTALCLYLTINSDKYDLKDWYEITIKRFFSKQNRKFFGLLTTGKIVMDPGVKEYYEYLKEHKVPDIKSINKYHAQISVLKGLKLKRKIIDSISTEKELIQLIKSSCGIPLLINFGVFNKFQNHTTLDGCLTGQIPYKYEDSQKIFLNVMPSQTNNLDIQNLSEINIVEGLDKKFPKDYLIWDQKWADDNYNQGYKAALSQKELIIQEFYHPEKFILQKQLLQAIKQNQIHKEKQKQYNKQKYSFLEQIKDFIESSSINKNIIL